jgi:hypothetical protein
MALQVSLHILQPTFIIFPMCTTCPVHVILHLFFRNNIWRGFLDVMLQIMELLTM